MSGGPTSQREPSYVQTPVTTGVSTKPSRQCMVLPTRSRVLCVVQTARHSSQTGNPCILGRWSEHFQALFSADRVVHDSAILRIPQQPVKVELDDPPSLRKLTKAIKQLKSVKAAGVDGIPPNIWKKGGSPLCRKLHELFVCCWEKSKLPKDLRDAVIVTLYKNKG